MNEQESDGRTACSRQIEPIKLDACVTVSVGCLLIRFGSSSKPGREHLFNIRDRQMHRCGKQGRSQEFATGRGAKGDMGDGSRPPVGSRDRAPEAGDMLNIRLNKIDKIQHSKNSVL